MTLKKITYNDVLLSTGSLVDLMMSPVEVVRIGEMEDLTDYADEHHLNWRGHPNMMFGGYWTDNDANAYIPW